MARKGGKREFACSIHKQIPRLQSRLWCALTQVSGRTVRGIATGRVRRSGYCRLRLVAV